MHTASLKLRLKALWIDYLHILGYLLVLALVVASLYIFILDGFPETTESQSHWIAFLTTTLPVTIYFTIREGRAPYISFGKKKVGLVIQYTKSPMLSSLIRNTLKFLPWHLGHYSVIKGLFTEDFSSPQVYIPYFSAILLPILYILMVGIRKDHRHLPDVIAQAYIVKQSSKKKSSN